MERRERAIAAVIFFCALALYARAALFPFIHLDDHIYVLDKPEVTAGLSWSGVAWAFTTLDQEFWHPLTWLSYMADVSLFGLRPGPMHAVNAVLHAASSALAFVALLRLTGARLPSALAAALFALHPAHVESVAWIAERKDLLSTLFGLLALAAYAGYARRPGPARYLGVALAFAASLMSKSMLVTLPFLLLLLDAWPLRRLGPGAREPWTRVVLEKVPLLALSAASSILTVVAQRRGGSMGAAGGALQLGEVTVRYARYLGMLLWPSDLAIFYPAPAGGQPASAVLAAGLLLAALSAGAVLALRRAPYLFTGWCWFLGTLVPVVGFVQVGLHGVADRYTYFPSLGLFVALSWGAAALLERAGGRLAPGAWAAALALLAVLAARTHVQLGLWSDDERLFRHAAAVTADGWRARELLAFSLRERGRDEEARQVLGEAVGIFPNAETLFALGAVSGDLGRTAEAEDAYRRALAANPHHDGAAVGLAELLARAGRIDEAVATLLASASAWSHREPELVPRRLRLAAKLAEFGRVDLALGELDAVSALAPDHPDLPAYRAEVALQRGDLALAGRLAEDALARGSRLAGGFLVLAVVRSERGDAAGALAALEQAARVDPRDPYRRLPLADLLAAAGRVPEACAQLAFTLESARSTPSNRAQAAAKSAALGCGGAARP